MPAHHTVNMGLAWTPTKDLRLALNVKNVTDRKPYYDPNGWEGYDHGLNLFGRVYNVAVSYRFW